jgi:MFS family permease
MLSTETLKNVRHNFTVGLLDGAFFGFGMGFASFVTVVPLFIATLTDSTTLIGLIASAHILGWQLPQLFTANRVARLRQYKTWVMLMTIHERWPFFALAILCLLIPVLGTQVALVLAFILLLWHSFGGGFAGTAWQSMIGKIIPSNRLGTFYGSQSSAANLLASGGAVVAGIILERVESPYNFAICFFASGVLMMISWVFLAKMREPDSPPAATSPVQQNLWKNARRILRSDSNYRWFIIARILAQCAAAGISFYTIYAVRHFDMQPETAGIMAGLLLIGQTVASPVLGWAGDHWGHRRVFILGILILSASVVLAMVAPSLGWFYLVFALAGFANAVLWTTTMSITLEFGTQAERPFYIGLTNTLIAPATLLAPIIGGWLVDGISFHVMFLVVALVGLASVFIFQTMVADPRHVKPAIKGEPVAAVILGD